MPYRGNVIRFGKSGKVGPTYLYDHEAATGLLDAGFERTYAIVALAVMKEESWLSPDAEGDLLIQDDEWGPSIGVMQIRSRRAEKGKGTSRDALVLTDPKRNLSEAFNLFRVRGFKPWGAFTSGRYKPHMPWAEKVFADLPDADKPTERGNMPLTYDRPSGYTQVIPPGVNAIRYGIGAWFGLTRTEVIRDRSRCQQSSSEHCVCRGIDEFTTDLVLGRSIFDFCVWAAERLGIQSVIFNRRVWGFGNWTERHYTPSGNATIEHRDHVHIGVNKWGAANVTRAMVDAALREFFNEEEDILSAVTREEWDALVKEVASIKTYLGSKDPAEAGKAVGRGTILSDVDWKIEAARRGGFSHQTGKPNPESPE